MDLKQFAYRLKVANESPKSEKRRIDKIFDLQILKERMKKQFFVDKWEHLERFIDNWDGPVRGYLNEMGKMRWGENGFKSCEVLDKEVVKRDLYNSLICPIPPHTIEVMWYVEGPPYGIGIERCFPIFAVRMIINTKPDQKFGDLSLPLTCYIQVLDRIGSHGYILDLENLAETLLESFDQGPYYREFGFVER